MGEYKWNDGLTKLGIRDDGDDAEVRLKHPTVGQMFNNVPPLQRRAAAQALAGDEWRVVPAKQPMPHDDERVSTMQDDLRLILLELGLGDHARQASPHKVVIGEVLPRIRDLAAAEPDRVEPVDPADVRVGDVVEVTHSHGYAGLTIVITGEVYKVDDNPVHPFHLIGYGSPEIGDKTTVRWVRRAEPDPDQLDAVTRILVGINNEHDALAPNTNHAWLARELIRRGMRVDGGPDDE